MQTRRILVVGQSGTGKTTLARELVRSAARILVLDPVPDVDGGWATTCEMALSWDDVFPAVRRPRFRVALQEEVYGIDDAQNQLETAVRVVRSPEVGRCWLVVDELSIYFRKGREAPEGIQGAVRFGRRQGVDLMLISQRAMDCPVEVRSQLTDLYAFRLVERDIEHLSAFIGRKNAELIADLPRYHHLHFDLTKPLSGEEVDDARETLDLDRRGISRRDLDRREGPVPEGQRPDAARGRLTDDETEDDEQ